MPPQVVFPGESLGYLAQGVGDGGGDGPVLFVGGRVSYFPTFNNTPRRSYGKPQLEKRTCHWGTKQDDGVFSPPKTATTCPGGLLGWAGHHAVGAKDTAITRLWL